MSSKRRGALYQESEKIKLPKRERISKKRLGYTNKKYATVSTDLKTITEAEENATAI
ncbi:MAG: hypothetical protein AAGE84_21020 [Cyanobacteria bacterium P01_G01_bin.39]